MKAPRFAGIVTGASALLCLAAFGQKKSLPPPPTASDSSVTIITEVPFEGTNYFITIVPIDPAQDIPMPTYKPDGKRTFFWRDSLQHLFPDSLLKSLPRRKAPRRAP